MNRTSLIRRIVTGSVAAGVAALTVVGVTTLAVAPANAAEAASASVTPPAPPTSPAPAPAPASTVAGASASTGSTGWVRVGHLSPDTKSVDVKLSALAGGAMIFELKNVAYGQVSPYSSLAAGTYVVSMVPAGSPESTKAMISTNVTVKPGEADTVAAYGPNAKLKTKVFTDDLTGPAAGKSRIRLIQASTRVKSVDVSTTTGIPIATDAQAGSATAYASVPVGPWGVTLVSPTTTSAASIILAPGTVNTLFVLDNASGGLTLMSVLDSAAAGETPDGSLETGGGGLRDSGSSGIAAAPAGPATAGAPAKDPLGAIVAFFSHLFGTSASTR